MTTDQLFTVAISPEAQSRTASVQVPFGVVSSVVHDVTVDGKLVGPIAEAASALNVLVNGEADEVKAIPPKELITVLVKSSPSDPSWFTRFRFPPLGAIMLKERSPSNVMVTLLSTTATSTTVAPAGIPLTVMLFVVPAARLSGTANEPVELNVLVKFTAGDDGTVSNCDEPVQKAADDGVIENAEGPLLIETVTATEPHVFVYWMLAVPAATPVTTPVRVPTVAMDVLRLLHVPPVAVSISVEVVPTQNDVVPVIADGVEFTVTTTVAAVPQPVL